MTALLKVLKMSAIGWSAPAEAGRRLDPGQRPGIGDHPGEGRCGGRQGRGQEGPAALALATLEVPIRGADRVLAGGQLVAVHGDAHRTARLAPLGAGRPEDLVEALVL